MRLPRIVSAILLAAVCAGCSAQAMPARDEVLPLLRSLKGRWALTDESQVGARASHGVAHWTEVVGGTKFHEEFYMAGHDGDITGHADFARGAYGMWNGIWCGADGCSDVTLAADNGRLVASQALAGGVSLREILFLDRSYHLNWLTVHCDPFGPCRRAGLLTGRRMP